MTLCQLAHVSRLHAICNPKPTDEQDGGRIWLVSFPFPVTTLMSFIARFKVVRKFWCVWANSAFGRNTGWCSLRSILRFL